MARIHSRKGYKLKQIIDFKIAEINPDGRDVLLHQGIPKGVEVPERIRVLLAEGVDIFRRTAQPKGVIEEVSLNQFENTFVGEGKNIRDVILERIYPKSDHLALYVLTMGEDVSSRIEKMFNEGDYALGSMLDAVASLAADKASEVFEEFYRDYLDSEEKLNPGEFVLSYSPGYCGWHISGQKKLFDRLKPGLIGVTLNDSYLMTPLKSVSGVLVGGNKEIHIFDNNFEYCKECKHESCLDRMKRIQTI